MVPQTLELHVNPNGSDQTSLSVPDDRILQNLHDAAVTVRDMEASGSPIDIIVHPGSYYLDRSLDLRPGTTSGKTALVTWRAKEEGTVILSGAVPLDAFTPVTDPAVLDRLPEASRSKVRVIDLQGKLEVPSMPQSGGPDLELIHKGRRMPRGRYPSRGWLEVADIPQSGPIRYNEGLDREKRFDGVPAGRHYGRINYPGDRPSAWSSDNDIYLHGYWTFDWSDTIHRAEVIDTEKREITLAEPHHQYGYTRNQRFAFLNVLEELDTPGEWVVLGNYLYFYPPDGRTVEVTISRLSDPLIRIEDGRNLCIQGLVFENSRGHGVTVSGGQNGSIEGSVFRNLGGDDIVIDGGQNHRVDSCDLYNLACGGIRADGGDRKTLTPSGHVLTNNHIHDFCQWLNTGSYGIIFDGVGFHIAHNLIHDSPFEAIYLRGNDHLLEYNEIHSVMKESGDAGALHTGRDYTWQGNVIRFNYLHHLTGPGLHGVMGVYLDDFSSGFTVFGNIFYQAGRATLLSGGHDNTVDNNLYIDCEPSIHYDARGLSWAHYYFDGTYTWLVDRYREMNAAHPPYSERYPHLKGIFDQNPEVPEGNRITRNISIGSGRWIDVYDYHAFDFEASVVMRDNLIANPGICRRREISDGAWDPYYLDIDGAEGYVLLAVDDPEVSKEFAGNQVVSGPVGKFDPISLEFTPADPSLLDSIGFEPIPVREIGLQPDAWRSSIPPRICGDLGSESSTRS